MKHQLLVGIIMIFGLLSVGTAVIYHAFFTTPELEATFRDIEHRNYDIYKAPSAEEKATFYERNLLEPYLYVVEQKYLELRISEEDAMELGVSPEIYQQLLRECESGKVFTKNATLVSGMEYFEYYHDAVRQGLIDPNKRYPMYHPLLPSIRTR